MSNRKHRILSKSSYKSKRGFGKYTAQFAPTNPLVLAPSIQDSSHSPTIPKSQLLTVYRLYL